MSHLVRVQADNVWVRGYVTVGADLKAIDQNTFLAINGDEGGLWEPSDPIVIGGAGIILGAPSTVRGVGEVKSFVIRLIVFGKGTSDDYFGIRADHPGRSVEVTRPIMEVFAPVPDEEYFNYSFGTSTTPSGIRVKKVGAQFWAAIGSYSGARIDEVVIQFYVGETHSTVPSMPKFRVVAIDAYGVTTPLRSEDDDTDPDGFQSFPAPLTGSEWYAAGELQEFSYLCNTNHIMDSSVYTYMLEIIDDSSWTTTGNYYAVTIVKGTAFLLDGRN